MSFQLQEWERGMSSMPSGSGWLAGLPSASWGVPALLGTSLPQPLPKAQMGIATFEAISLWRGLEEQSLGLRSRSLLCGIRQCRSMGIGAAIQICPMGHSLLVPVLW